MLISSHAVVSLATLQKAVADMVTNLPRGTYPEEVYIEKTQFALVMRRLTDASQVCDVLIQPQR